MMTAEWYGQANPKVEALSFYKWLLLAWSSRMQEFCPS